MTAKINSSYGKEGERGRGKLRQSEKDEGGMEKVETERRGGRKEWSTREEGMEYNKGERESSS